jgi:hypothetical protein
LHTPSVALRVSQSIGVPAVSPTGKSLSRKPLLWADQFLWADGLRPHGHPKRIEPSHPVGNANPT